VKSVIDVPNKRGKGNHPTQKPAELYEWLLKRYCPNGTMLDPTAGSFTSCFVAEKLGLTAIGIEKDKTFYEKANQNLVV
jgi:site-specific DNA-methyltransferase (adenine-specific)